MINIVLRTQIFTEAWSRTASEQVLDIILEALVEIDLLYLRLNPSTPRLYKSGVRYFHTGIADEWFTIDEALHEMLADCKGLSAWLVAEYRHYGIDPGAKCFKKFAVIDDPTVGKLVLYHIMVQRSDGTIEDPSRVLGMNKSPEPDGFLPVPGVAWTIVNGLEHIIGAGLNGNQTAITQLKELRRRAEKGDARAKYLIEVARIIRKRGYDPSKNEFARLPDGSWHWVRPGDQSE